MVEAYQNIVRHRPALPFYGQNAMARPAFIVRSNDRIQSLVAINVVPDTIKDQILDRVKHINSLSAVELKRAFLEGLESNSISEKGGAGLGLIEMARRSKNRLGCRMKPLEKGYSIYHLAVIIGESSKDEVEALLDTAEDFHRICVEEDLMLLHKGELSASAVSAVLPMVQRDMDDSPHKASIRSRAYLAAIEVFRSLDNTSDGIFSLCRNGDDYVISVGQELSRRDAEQLESVISSTNGLSKEQLDVNFRRSLLSQDPKDKEERGLLDLAICSKEKLEYSTEPKNERVFFSIKAFV